MPFLRLHLPTWWSVSEAEEHFQTSVIIINHESSIGSIIYCKFRDGIGCPQTWCSINIKRRLGSSFWMPCMFWLCTTTDTTMPKWTSCMRYLPAKINLLSNMSWTTGKYQKFRNGKGSELGPLSVQVYAVWMWSNTSVPRKDWSWRTLWISSILLSMPWSIM